MMLLLLFALIGYLIVSSKPWATKSRTWFFASALLMALDVFLFCVTLVLWLTR